MIEVARRSGAPLHLSHLKVIGNPAAHRPAAGADRQARARPRRHLRPVPVLRRLDDAGVAAARLGAGRAAPRPRSRGWTTPTPAPHRRDVAVGPAGLGEHLPHLRARAHLGRPGRARRATTPRAARWPSWRGAGIDPLTSPSTSCATRRRRTMIDGYADEEAVRHILVHPAMVLGSDGIFGARPHPRIYGATPASSAATRCARACCRSRSGRPADQPHRRALRPRPTAAHRHGPARRPRAARPGALRRHRDLRRPVPAPGRRRAWSSAGRPPGATAPRPTSAPARS